MSFRWSRENFFEKILFFRNLPEGLGFFKVIFVVYFDTQSRPWRDCRDSVLKFFVIFDEKLSFIDSTIVETWSILFLHFDKMQKFFITESLQFRSFDRNCVSKQKKSRKVVKRLSKRAKDNLIHSLCLLHSGDMIARNLIRGWNRKIFSSILIHSLDFSRDCRDSVIILAKIRQKSYIASTIVEAWSIH